MERRGHATKGSVPETLQELQRVARLTGSHARASSLVADHGEDENGGAGGIRWKKEEKLGVGFLVLLLSLLLEKDGSTCPFVVHDSNCGIGLVFAS